jgi:hypothetical protein
VTARTTQAAAAYAPRELDGPSFGPEDIASMSAAFEAALGQLGVKERPPHADTLCTVGFPKL